jgi:formate/nitrite transporter FocA (FNT family)
MMCGLEVSAGKAVWFIAVVTLGNLLGGSLLAAALNYGHIRKSQEHD